MFTLAVIGFILLIILTICMIFYCPETTISIAFLVTTVFYFIFAFTINDTKTFSYTKAKFEKVKFHNLIVFKVDNELLQYNDIDSFNNFDKIKGIKRATNYSTFGLKLDSKTTFIY